MTAPGPLSNAASSAARDAADAPRWVTAVDLAPLAGGRVDARARTEPGLAEVVDLVERFVPVEAAQAHHRKHLLEFVDRHSDALHRTCELGHLTASAWLVDHEAKRGLVLLHTKIGRWLQPGGHADGESCLASVALREATEETGIAGLEVWTQPIDIDVHLFVNQRRTEPDHLHFDVRFLVRAPSGAQPQGNHESQDLRWVLPGGLDDPELDLDVSTRRLARCAFALTQSAELNDSGPSTHE